MCHESNEEILYNVGTGVRTSLKELAEILIELTGTSANQLCISCQATLVRNRIGCPKKVSEDIAFSASIEP